MIALPELFPVIVSLDIVLVPLAHGIFMSVSSVIAAEVVSPDKRASAIAVMFTGIPQFFDHHVFVVIIAFIQPPI